MAEIRDTGRTAIVVTERQSTAAAVTVRTQVAVASSPGPQGPQGVPGPTGGEVVQRIAATVLGGHRVVRAIDGVAVGYASAAVVGQGDDTLGITTTAADAGANLNVQTVGQITFNGWGWTPGEQVFLAVDGLLTQSPPGPEDGAEFLQVIGTAVEADTLLIAIQPPIDY